MIPALLLFLVVPDPDLTAVRKVAVLHGERVKPFDTFAREMMWTLSGSQRFSGYKDPRSGDRVRIFPTSDPTAALLHILSRPDAYKTRPMIPVGNLKLKERLGWDLKQAYFSYTEVRMKEKDLRMWGMNLPDEQRQRTKEDKAAMKLWSRYRVLAGLFTGEIIRLIPVGAGEWASITEIRTYLDGGRLDPIVREGLGRIPGGKLERIRDTFDSMLQAFAAKGDPSAFETPAVSLQGFLRDAAGPDYPPADRLDMEVSYNQVAPFRWALWIYGIGLAVFLGLFIFKRSGTWWGIPILVLGIAFHAYGLIQRWVISGRQPFSNMYESMVMLGLCIAITCLILEGLQRRHLFGIASSFLGWIVVALAEYVDDFNPFIKPLVPALQSFWMTIHVPAIMLAYGGALILGVLGHIYIFTGLFAPKRAEDLGHVDTAMYRALQVTVLFMIGGVALGAVWAGEAWGRYWGWDMKEVWALISLVFYVAMLHCRLVGLAKGYLLAAASAVGTALIVLTYYGVNFVFGSGLHSYGFGDGRWAVLIGICVVEAAVAVVGVVLWLRERKRTATRPA